MPTNFGSTPYSSETLPADTFPVAAAFVPNTANGDLTATQAGPASTDSNGYTSAPVACYIADGNDVTQGTSTDANTVNTVMGRLTKIRDLLLATLTIAGNVTEANSAAIKADLDAVNTAIGAVSDVAWSGSGNGSEIAILKKIVAELAATLTVSGSISVSNFPATQPVSGTVTANAGSGTFTNQQSNVQSDYDTGAGTQSMTMFGLALPASGGAVPGGTASNPLRVDPIGTTTQPVSAASLPLPTGAAQEAGNLASISSNTSNTATVAGATADAAVTGDSAGTLSGKLRGLTKIFGDIWDSVNHRIKVDGSGVTQPVSGTFWQATQPVSGTVTASPQAATAGGSTPYHAISSSGTNSTNVKNAAGMLYGLSISNSNAAARFFKLYDKATAPTVGTDTPKRTIQIPANATVITAFPVGLAFTSGIGYGCTTGIADTDTGSVGTDISIDLDYK